MHHVLEWGHARHHAPDDFGLPCWCAALLAGCGGDGGCIGRGRCSEQAPHRRHPTIRARRRRPRFVEQSDFNVRNDPLLACFAVVAFSASIIRGESYACGCRVDGRVCCAASSYEHLTAEQVLHKLIPEGVTVPTSFETVGHLAHLNLLDETLPCVLCGHCVV